MSEYIVSKKTHFLIAVHAAVHRIRSDGGRLRHLLSGSGLSCTGTNGLIPNFLLVLVGYTLKRCSYDSFCSSRTNMADLKVQERVNYWNLQQFTKFWLILNYGHFSLYLNFPWIYIRVIVMEVPSDIWKIRSLVMSLRWMTLYAIRWGNNWEVLTK